MASKTSLPFALFFLCFMVIQPRIESKSIDSPFGFIQHLEGCHKGQTVKGLHGLKRYLEKLGYLNNDIPSNNHANEDDFDDLLESAIKEYQRSYHLNVTGSLDLDTVNQMMKPRCGVADHVNVTKQNHHHHKLRVHTVGHYQFDFPGPKRWSKSQLTYNFRSSVQYTTSELQLVRSIIQQAFQRWARVSHFTFQEVAPTSQSDIVIGFHRLNHGDNDPFDGKFGTTAHAFYPPDGRCHFDADESWSANPGPDQLDFESVAVHEIGHLLGLAHETRKPDAIMYPYFNYGQTKRALAADDIQGIRVLYGLQP